MPTIAILDYGAGNLYSIAQALQQLGSIVQVTSQPQDIQNADGFILPGVGAFKDSLPAIHKILPALTTMIDAERPVLGICLGMQLFFTESEEDGLHQGLNLIRGRVERLPDTVKVPHMGWNTLHNLRRDPLTAHLHEGDYVYFVHSYAPVPVDPAVILAESTHGRVFPAIVRWKSVWGTQFHPEKSGAVGQQILKNFIGLL